MFKDDIVEEVRKNRKKIFAECGNDLEAYFSMLKIARDNFKTESAELLERRQKKHARRKAA